jgi:hypothetical protein
MTGLGDKLIDPNEGDVVSALHQRVVNDMLRRAVSGGHGYVDGTGYYPYSKTSAGGGVKVEFAKLDEDLTDAQASTASIWKYENNSWSDSTRNVEVVAGLQMAGVLVPSGNVVLIMKNRGTWFAVDAWTGTEDLLSDMQISGDSLQYRTIPELGMFGVTGDWQTWGTAEVGTFVTDLQVSGVTVQQKSRSAKTLGLGTETDWTTWHTGGTC